MADWSLPAAALQVSSGCPDAGGLEVQESGERRLRERKDTLAVSKWKIEPLADPLLFVASCGGWREIVVKSMYIYMFFSSFFC